MSRHEQAGVLWLGLGIFLWSLVIGPPGGDNYWIRQTQAVEASQSWIAQGHSSWDAAVSWRGDPGARLLGFHSM